MWLYTHLLFLLPWWKGSYQLPTWGRKESCGNIAHIAYIKAKWCKKSGSGLKNYSVHKNGQGVMGKFSYACKPTSVLMSPVGVRIKNPQVAEHDRCRATSVNMGVAAAQHTGDRARHMLAPACVCTLGPRGGSYGVEGGCYWVGLGGGGHVRGRRAGDTCQTTGVSSGTQHDTCGDNKTRGVTGVTLAALKRLQWVVHHYKYGESEAASATGVCEAGSQAKCC